MSSYQLISFWDHKIELYEGVICPLYFSFRQLNQNELIWRHVPKTSIKHLMMLFMQFKVGWKIIEITPKELPSTRTVIYTGPWSLMSMISIILPFLIQPNQIQSSWGCKRIAKLWWVKLAYLTWFHKLETCTLDSISDNRFCNLFVWYDWSWISWYTICCLTLSLQSQRNLSLKLTFLLTAMIIHLVQL